MNTESNICVSVIIPVYNEERYIERCMDSLFAQSFPRNKMEWIVIDGNSTDRTRELLSRYEEEAPLRVLVNDKRTTPRSLNMGIKEARGAYLIRFDAHASFPPDYIEKCVHCLETVEADNVGGFVETKAEGFIGSAIAKLLSSRFGVGGSSFRVSGKAGYVDTVPFGAFRREVFDNIGLFREELLRSEDNDINARIIENGGKVYLSDDIHSIYYCRDSIQALLRQSILNGNALFQTIRQNPKAMHLRHFVPFFFLLSLLILPLLGLAFPPARWLLFIELIIYGSADLVFSFFCGSPEKGLITFWLFPLYHLTYGFGSLLGLFGIHLF